METVLVYHIKCFIRLWVWLLRSSKAPPKKSIGAASKLSLALLKNVQCMSRKLPSRPKLIHPSIFYHHSSWCCWSPSQMPSRQRAGFYWGHVASSGLSQHRETSHLHPHLMPTQNMQSSVNKLCKFLGCWMELEKLWTSQQASFTPTRFCFKVHRETKSMAVGLRNGLQWCRTAQTS